MTTLELAKQYVSFGYSVVPVAHGTKRPAIEWKRYQSQLASPEELESWFTGQNDYGLGVVCGAVSGNLVCLDFDDIEASNTFKQYPANEALLARGSVAHSDRGFHLFFRSPVPVSSTGIYLNGHEGKVGDLLAEGKFVVLPPTKHPSGFVRTWLRPIGENLVHWSIDDLSLGEPPRMESNTPKGCVVKGDRHNSMVTLAKEYSQAGLDFDQLSKLCLTANTRDFDPPLPRDEVLGIARHFAWADIRPPYRHPEREDKGNPPRASFLPNPIPIRDEEKDNQDFGNLFLPATEYALELAENPINWVVEGMIPLNSIVIVGATSKSGKSCLITNLANAVSTGTPFLGMPTTQGAVLWLAFEESRSERSMILNSYNPRSPELYITHSKLSVDSKEGIEALRFWIRKTKAKLIVIDPLYGAVQTDSLSDGRKARMALESLKELCDNENATAVILHHLNKDVSAGSTRERMADSGQILATASIDWIMETRTMPDKTREIKLLGAGRGEFANKNWLILSRSAYEYELIASGSSEECDRGMIDERLVAVVQSFEHGGTAEDIAKAANAHMKTTQNRLTALVKENRLTVIGKVGKANVYGADRVLIEG